MLSFLLTLISGPLLSGLIGAYKAKLEAMNSTEARAVELAEAEIQAEIQANAEASKIIQIEQGWWVTAIIRPLLAFPVIIYFWKVIVWDKVFNLGSTDPLNGMIGDWAGMIIIAYVGGRTVEKVSRIFAHRL